MSVLLVIGIVVAVWISLCVLIVALCVSAKEGDVEEPALEPEAVPQPRRRRFRRSAPALS